MAVYAIGDIQGCFQPLRRLLDKIAFDQTADTLWFCGDLVNRGPQSLQTLRFVKDLGPAAITVLGNHDLHLLALATLGKTTANEGLAAIVEADDGVQLLRWLRERPLLHVDKQHQTILVHAGIHPDWDLHTATTLSDELASVLSGESHKQFFETMYGNSPTRWSDELRGCERLRYAVNVFTRMRLLSADGALDFKYKGELHDAPKKLRPWFQLTRKISPPWQIVFGHWSALGLHEHNNTVCLDSGCVWGRSLSALRIDGPAGAKAEVIQVNCEADQTCGD